MRLENPEEIFLQGVRRFFARKVKRRRADALHEDPINRLKQLQSEHRL